MSIKTSCSDNGVYPPFCELASSNDRVFAEFRRNPVYCGVVETVSYAAGRDYLERILLQSKAWSRQFSEFSKNDVVGNPLVFAYRYGLLKRKQCTFAPTTLRYIKVLADMKALFGVLDNMRIAEIGGGYGGQCAIVSRVFRPARYTIIDLEPCLRLARRYLEASGISDVTYVTIGELDEAGARPAYDLVISNYAFSELSRSVQDEFVGKVIAGASRGYFMCNFATHTWEGDQYSQHEMMELRRDARVFRESPPLSVIDREAKVALVVFGGEVIDGWVPEIGRA